LIWVKRQVLFFESAIAAAAQRRFGYRHHPELWSRPGRRQQHLGNEAASCSQPTWTKLSARKK
jgi:hypothetical protein